MAERFPEVDRLNSWITHELIPEALTDPSREGLERLNEALLNVAECIQGECPDVSDEPMLAVFALRKRLTDEFFGKKVTADFHRFIAELKETGRAVREQLTVIAGELSRSEAGGSTVN